MDRSNNVPFTTLSMCNIVITIVFYSILGSLILSVNLETSEESIGPVTNDEF